MPSTSTLGSGLGTEGLLIQVGSAASPPVFTTIANTSDMKMPVMSEVVDVTNFGDNWRRRIPTLHDMGKITFKMFWEMTDPTQDNTSGGMRYLMINNLKRTFQFVYPDGLSSIDSFPGYVTKFDVTGKVGGVFEADVELVNDGAPTLV